VAAASSVQYKQLTAVIAAIMLVMSPVAGLLGAVGTADAASGTGTIEGQVTDRSGNPISGATVEIVVDNQTYSNNPTAPSNVEVVKTVTTDSNGNYSVSVDTSKTYRVRVKADGYAQLATFSEYSLADGSTMTVDMPLYADSATTTVSGNVTGADETVDGVEGIPVAVFTDGRDGETIYRYGATATTNADGSYSVSGVPDGADVKVVFNKGVGDYADTEDNPTYVTVNGTTTVDLTIATNYDGDWWYGANDLYPDHQLKYYDGIGVEADRTPEQVYFSYDVEESQNVTVAVRETYGDDSQGEFRKKTAEITPDDGVVTMEINNSAGDVSEMYVQSHGADTVDIGILYDTVTDAEDADDDGQPDIIDEYHSHAPDTETVQRDAEKTPETAYAQLGQPTETTVTVEAWNNSSGSWEQVEKKTVTPDDTPHVVKIGLADYTGSEYTEFRVTAHGQDATEAGVVYESGSLGGGGFVPGDGGGSIPLSVIVVALAGFAVFGAAAAVIED
jgi:hypothetical protein